VADVFRQGELVPAVEYLRAHRLRTIVMREMAQIMGPVDVYVVPSFGGDNELLTNLTGHPAVVVPNGFRQLDGTPTSVTFQGRLDDDDLTLAVADAYQKSHRLPHPSPDALGDTPPWGQAPRCLPQFDACAPIPGMNKPILFLALVFSMMTLPALAAADPDFQKAEQAWRDGRVKRLSRRTAG